MGRVKRSTRIIRWIETHCRIPDGVDVGQPVRLRRFQKKIIRGIYDSPTRMAIVCVGRKNGKTGLSAFLLLIHLAGPESRPNSQLYSTAQSREQAAIIFELAAKIVRMSPSLSEFIGIRDTSKHLYCHELGTIYKALSAEAKTAYGLSPVFTVHDELGQVVGPRSLLYEALETASGAHEKPLSIIISTQAPTDGDLLSILIDDAKTKADPKVKLFMWSADESLDPFSQKAIKAANPAFGDFLQADEVKSQAASAKRMPAREASYRNLVLNQRVNQTSPLIPRAVWEACNGAPSLKVLKTGVVYAGLDLSARNDLTALCYGARDADNVWHVYVEFFAPQIGVKDRSARDRAPYDLWAEQGYITLTPGASVDYKYVAKRLIDLCDTYDVGAIHYDRWRIEDLRTILKDVGHELPLEEFGQGYKSMGPAIENIESDLLNYRFKHGNNPVLNWCAANTISTKDPAGFRKPDKVKSTGRIDGMVAMIMAFGPIKTIEDDSSIYETRGIVSV